MTAIARPSFATNIRIGPVTGATVLLAAVMTLLVLAAFVRGYEVLAARGLPLALIIHLMTVIPALPLGAYIFLRRKGDRTHRMLGRIWAMLMVTTAIASLGVGDNWSPIHILSFTTLGSVILSIVRIRQGKVTAHKRAMEAVFIGLVIAGAFTFIPGRRLGTMLLG